MFSNGVRVKGDVERFNKDGYLAQTPWVRPAEREAWARLDAMTPVSGEVTPAAQPQLSPEDWQAHLSRGELMMRGQCMACHTVDGYRPLRKLLAGRDRQAVGNILEMLRKYADDSPYKKYMPPLVGVPGEVSALTDYLTALVAAPADAAPVAVAKN